MSNMVKKLSKSVTKHKLVFDKDMYDNALGSLIITHYILSNPKPSVNSIKLKWKYLKKKGIDFWLDDEKFIPKALALFGMEPLYGMFAMVQSEYNILFAPYLPIEKIEEPQILPIREDGIYSTTLRIGKIYPIKEVIDDLDEQRIEEEIEAMSTKSNRRRKAKKSPSESES